MNFRDLRKKFGTQKELSNILNVSQSILSKWENGQAYPRRQKLKKISELFGVSEMDVLISIDRSKYENTSGDNSLSE